MDDKTRLIAELNGLLEMTESVLDLAVTLRDAAPRGQKAPFRRIDRRLDKMATELLKTIEEYQNA